MQWRVRQCIVTWFREVTAAGVDVAGTLLGQKTSAFSLGVDNVLASGGWFHCFKATHGFSGSSSSLGDGGTNFGCYEYFHGPLRFALLVRAGVCSGSTPD